MEKIVDTFKATGRSGKEYVVEKVQRYKEYNTLKDGPTVMPDIVVYRTKCGHPLTANKDGTYTAVMADDVLTPD